VWRRVGNGARVSGWNSVTPSKLAAKTIAARTRVDSVDALRGLIMIVMALDHTRDFFHAGAMSFSPEDLSRTNTLLFLTRWVTHFCAPVFFFTAGLGAYFQLQRGKSPAELSRFLWSRGLWLVVLELTALRFAMTFSLTSGLTFLSILWALGWSMVALGFLVRLPVRVLAVFSLLVIVLHNLADSVNAAQFGSAAWVWNVLHQNGLIVKHGIMFVVAYPLVPWFAVMAAGFCFGEIATLEAAARRRWMIRIGLAMTLAFIVIRWINGYGDPQPWTTKFPGMTLLSFLRTTKYPPSLDFLLMTLGPALLLWAWLDRLSFSKKNPLIVFGRVPLFYFLLHFLLIHLLTIPLALWKYGHAGFLLNPLPSIGGSAKLFPPEFGYPLWVVYAVWISVVVMVYPACLWFMRVKERRRDWWLSYL
jgi:uncharacterized membrane protein